MCKKTEVSAPINLKYAFSKENAIQRILDIQQDLGYFVATSDCTLCKDCNAVTVEPSGYQYDDKYKFQVARNLFEEVFGKRRFTQKYYGCDYCVNHWGLDLCDCGSGQPLTASGVCCECDDTEEEED